MSEKDICSENENTEQKTILSIILDFIVKGKSWKLRRWTITITLNVRTAAKPKLHRLHRLAVTLRILPFVCVPRS